MTSPLGGFEGLGAIGAAYINFRARTDQVDDDLRKGLDSVAKDADKITDKSGKALGQSLAKDIEQGAKDGITSPGFSRRITNTITKTFHRRKVKVKVDVDVDVNKNTFSRIASNLIKTLASAGTAAGSRFGSNFSNMATRSFQGIGDLVGSIGSSIGNVSSRGPLGIIVGGAIIAGIPALIAAASSLIAVLAPLVNVLLLVPAALAVIPAAIIPVVAAFWGMSEAIAAVLSEDPEQIEKAFANMSKGARQFALDIGQKVIPILKGLQQTMQTAFFQAFEADKDGLTVFDKIAKALRDAEGGGMALPNAMANAARAAGRFAANLLLVIENPSVQKFIEKLFNTTGTIFDVLGPGLNDFIIGLSDLGLVSLPKIESGARSIGAILSQFGGWLSTISNNGQFNEFMDKLSQAWSDLKELASSGWNFVKAVVGSTEEEGRAAEFFEMLTEVIDMLTEFFTSDIGKEAMRGWVYLAEIFLGILFGIIVAWIALGVIVEGARRNITFMVTGIKKFYDWVVRVINKFSWLRTLLELTSSAFAIFGGNLPGLAAGGVVTSPTMAMLGEGSKPEVVIPLTDRARATELAQVSGLAAMLNQGQNGGNGANGTTIIFGPDSVRVDFHGAVPSEQEAYQTGAAVATGISDQLAKRNVRLAVRTLRN